VILYADHVTNSIQKATQETHRRRLIQLQYNQEHHITPQTIVKKVRDIREEERHKVCELIQDIKPAKPSELPKLIAQLEKEMKEAAKNLEFELAAVLRDKIEELKI